jgi:hypothetical protein
MSENACYAVLVGRTSNEVCLAVVAQAALQGHLSFHRGLEIAAHDEDDSSAIVHVEPDADADGTELIQISIEQWESRLLDLAALSRTLACAMMCKQIVSQGIHCETEWFLHEGEELYREGETIEGHLFLECPSLGIHLSQATSKERGAARLRVLAWLRERGGETVDHLLNAEEALDEE